MRQKYGGNLTIFRNGPFFTTMPAGRQTIKPFRPMVTKHIREAVAMRHPGLAWRICPNCQKPTVIDGRKSMLSKSTKVVNYRGEGCGTEMIQTARPNGCL